jgi:hypothetical protein
MNEKIDVNAFVEEQEIEPTPEHILWLAVIDRAMMDYIKPTIDLTGSARRSLNWFFFATEPAPFNLLWVSEMLCGDADVAKRVRKRIRELKQNPDKSDIFYGMQHHHVRSRKLTSLLIDE